jgi:hypothetical protein
MKEIACLQQLWITCICGSTLVGMRTANLGVFAVLLTTTTVFACTCVSSEPSPSICQMAKAKAVTVFVGKVEHIGLDDNWVVIGRFTCETTKLLVARILRGGN